MKKQHVQQPSAGSLDRRLVKRLVIAGILAVLATVGILAGFYLACEVYLRHAEDANREKILLVETKKVSQYYTTVLEEQNYTDISQVYTRPDTLADAGIFSSNVNGIKFAMIVDSKDLVVLHTDKTQEGMVLNSRGSFQRAKDGNDSVEHTYINIDGELTDIIDITVPLHLQGRIQGALRIGFLPTVLNQVYVRETMARHIRTIAIVFLFIAIAGLTGLAGYVSQLFIQQYRELVNRREQQEKQQIEIIGTGIVHEVKNSLNGIRMNAQLLQDSLTILAPEQRERLRKKIERIQNEADRTGTVLSEFLSYAKPTAFRPALVNMPVLLEDLAQFFEPECRNRAISLRNSCSGDLAGVYADEQQLRHGISNLLWNAIQAIGRDGSISLTGARRNDMMEITVTDTGGGMPADVAAKVFELFYSTKPKGAGLGLSIVQRVASVHDGELTLENTSGSGCAFSIRIPLKQL